MSTRILEVPFNDLKRRPAPLAAFQRVMERGWYVMGPELAAFESAFAAYCGGRDCVGVANGTDALELALRAAGIRDGQEVATVANAGMYSTTAIRAAGAVPLFVDVDPHHGLMCPASLEAAISSATRAIIVTHLYGRMAPMRDLAAIAEGRGIPIIEDCAQAAGAELEGRKAGAWGLAGCFSFYPTKNLGACGDGGAVVSNDSEFIERLRALRQYGWRGRYDSRTPGGRNSRLDELQAAVLLDRLPALDRENAQRREIAERYSNALCGKVETPSAVSPDYVAHLYVVHTPQRDALRQWLAEHNIRAEIHYPVPDHLQPSQMGLPLRKGSLEVTERMASEILSLPCFPELSGEEIQAVIDRVLAWR